MNTTDIIIIIVILCLVIGSSFITIAPRPVLVMAVRGIESAPKDGTHILLYGTHEDDTGRFNTGWCEGYWSGISEWYHIVGLPSYPTHWTILPDKPGD